MLVDLSGPIKASFDKTLAEAKAHEQAGHSRDAAAAFMKAAGLMNHYAEYALTRDDELRRRRKARQYLELASALKDGAARKASAPAAGARPQARPRPSGVPAPRREDLTERPAEGERGEHAAAIEAMIVRKSRVEWDQIGGLADTKREIKFAYGLTLAAKPTGVMLPGWRRMLFYGPPGTGKTLMAAATANGLQATFFNVKVGGLLSKYFGESSRLVSALFDTARDFADEGFSVVFIDEFDAISLPRGEGSESGAERRVLATLLSELDGLADKGEDRAVLTIAATNAPWDLDAAVLSRFQKRIYIPLPDADSRRAILRILLEGAGHRLDAGLDGLVSRTEWFSGRDLERLAHQAINLMVEDANGPIADLVDRGRHHIEGYTVKVRPLTASDFDHAFERVRVDVNRQRELDARYREFAASN